MLVTKCNRVATQLADWAGRVNEFHVWLGGGSPLTSSNICTTRTSSLVP